MVVVFFLSFTPIFNCSILCFRGAMVRSWGWGTPFITEKFLELSLAFKEHVLPTSRLTFTSPLTGSSFHPKGSCNMRSDQDQPGFRCFIFRGLLILLMEEIRRSPVEGTAVSPNIYDGFYTSKRWLFGISEASTVRPSHVGTISAMIFQDPFCPRRVGGLVIS